jgi:PadR family transcriptional regulator, regulatory protein AphA
MDTPIESKSQDRALTTTSYAILSVLSLRPHSTYDITRQMRLTMHYIWPRAESNVYAEPRRLVEAGLVEAREEWNGHRRRTIYSITDAGRAALAEWLASPSARQRFECEPLVKVLFAENGTRDDMLASIRALEEDAAEVIRHFLEIADRYAAGEGAYPWRFALTGLAARLLMEQQAATLRWARGAEEVVAGWETPLSEDATWGVETLRATGQPFAMNEDPMREVLNDESRGDGGPDAAGASSTLGSKARARGAE